jgi:hypothetical protein
MVVMEDSENNGSFADPTWAYESKGCQVLGETNDPLDEFITSKAGLGQWGR